MGSAPMYVADIAEYFGVSRQVAAALLYRNVFGETQDTMCAAREAVSGRDETPLISDEVAHLLGASRRKVCTWLREGKLSGTPNEHRRWEVKFRTILGILGEHYGATLMPKSAIKDKRLEDLVLRRDYKWVSVIAPSGRRLYVLHEERGLNSSPEGREKLAGLLTTVLAKLGAHYAASEKFIEGFVEYQGSWLGSLVYAILGRETRTTYVDFVARVLIARYWVEDVEIGRRRFYRLAANLPKRVDPKWLENDDFDKTHVEMLQARSDRLCNWLLDLFLGDDLPPRTLEQLQQRLPVEMQMALLSLNVMSGSPDPALVFMMWAEAAAVEASFKQMSD